MEHVHRLKRGSNSANGNGRWLFGHFIQDGDNNNNIPLQGREIRRQQPSSYNAPNEAVELIKIKFFIKSELKFICKLLIF